MMKMKREVYKLINMKPNTILDTRSHKVIKSCNIQEQLKIH